MSIDFARYLNIRSATMPVMNPDGSRVAFLSDITGTFQVWSASASSAQPSGWPTQLTFFSDKVWELYGTPAAEHLIAVSDVGGNERQQLYLISGFGADGDAVPHTVTRVTSDDRAIHRFGAFSQDGGQIVYTSNARNQIDFDPYWMDLHSGESRRIAETTGNRAIIGWSPDDATVLMIHALASEQNELYLIDLATGVERHLTTGHEQARYYALEWTARGIFTLSDWDRDCFAVCRLDTENGAVAEILAAETLLGELNGGDGELTLLAVAEDAQQAAVSLNVEGWSHLYLLDLVDGSYTALTDLPRGVIHDLSFSPDGNSLLFDLQTHRHNMDVWRYDIAGATCRRLTFGNRAGIAPTSFVEPDLVHFATFDGRSLPAYYYRPQRDAPDGGYPCILYVHGGPAGQQRPDFDVRFQYFLQQGYALLVPNVRGSTGYGREYMMLDDVELRMDSVRDLKHAVLWLHAQTEIANARIAIYGRSYGGFMVLAALTEYPEYFAAGIDVVGIVNWVTFLERTGAWRRAHRAREYGNLEEHREMLTRFSPIHKIERITMPLLVIAGDNDPRVPLFESEQVVDRVRAAGGTVEFIHYADEGHKISKLVNRVDSFTRMADFLERYL